jgi:uncharacterized protein (TIRG00374 family)
LILDESESGLARDIGQPTRISWLRVIFSTLIGALAIYLVARNINVLDLQAAFARADLVVVAAGVMTIVATMLTKTWRWRLIFYPPVSRPRYKLVFWALMVGQFLNALLPMRLGEVGRAYSLERQAGTPIPTSFGTIVVEKTLDALTLAVMIVFLLPALLMPAYVTEQGYPLALLALIALALLLLLAYRSQLVLNAFQSLIGLLPGKWSERVTRWLSEGLRGLAALRNPRLVLVLGFASALIAGLSVLTPLLLFKAYGMPFSLKEAIFLNLVVSIGSAPPSTPGKVLIFETLVIVTLRRLGLVDSATMLSFAIVYHLVVALPQILLGGLALLRGGLRFSPILGR